MAGMTPELRVVIADDSALLRSGVARLLTDEGMVVVAEAGDPGALLDAVAAHRPDLAIIDVRLPPSYTNEGIHAALELRRRYPEVALLVLSQYVEEQSAGELLASSPRGVGYLLKDRVTDVEEFVETVRRVAGGGTALDPEVVAHLVAAGRSPGRKRLNRLSPREIDVLALMAEGLSNGAIARRLFITERAVEKHIRSLFPKLDLPPGEQEHHRRVLAVLHYLEATAGAPAVKTEDKTW